MATTREVSPVGRADIFRGASTTEQYTAEKRSGQVFKGCKGLKKIALGALTNVNLGDDSEAFFGLNTENVDLVLSESQKQMENRNNWYSTEEDYKSTDDYTKNIFLGRQFKSVTLQ